MTKPSNFIQSSDYATLKNDETGTFTLYVGDSGVITPGNSYIYSSVLTIGTVNSSIRSQMATSLDNKFWSTSVLQLTLRVTYYTGTNPEGNFLKSVIIERISPTQIRMYLKVENYFAFNIRITGGYQTVTANVATFLSPFE